MDTRNQTGVCVHGSGAVMCVGVRRCLVPIREEHGGMPALWRKRGVKAELG